MNYLPGYAGTSSVLAVVLLDRLINEQRQMQQGLHAQHAQHEQQWQATPDLKLVGTLAHEVSI